MTRPEAVRADTFDLQSNANIGGPLSTRNADLGFEGLDDDDEDIYDDDNEDDEDDGDALSSSPSIPDDDIDFDFMYALHSFAATVEGQANATKGDMLVLLDDSNSYWWLVRVVKDHTVGYLPAETIETPQERLARLNKHRNIDLTAIMLEDHSPTSRSSSRKPFRRKGAKTVVFNNSCTYYQLDSLLSDSEGEDEEDYITEAQLDDFDEQSSEHGDQAREDRTNALQQRRADLAELDELIDHEDHPSPRIGIETLDVSDYGGGKIMRIKDLNEQVGERPTSAIFRDSKLEPLKISVTPSIARDRTSLSPTEESYEMTSATKFKGSDSERDVDRKRSLSVSSAGESIGDPDPREKERDKKGRKNSVFGNLFKKRTKKPSKDDETRDFDSQETKVAMGETPTNRAETNEGQDSLRKDWTRPILSHNGGPSPPQNGDANLRNKVNPEVAKHPGSGSLKNQDVITTTPDLSLSPAEGHLSPAPTNGSSSLLTTSLPWFDASLHSFLDNDTSIRDVLVLVHEGSRLHKRSSADPINPQIADLYSACAIHIDEMSSHLDDVLMSYMFDLKT